MTVLSILDQLASTRSRIEKEAILKQHAGNEVLKRVFRLAYDKQTSYYMKLNARDLADMAYLAYTGTATLDDALYEIEFVIAARVMTGHSALAHVRSTMALLTKEDAVVLARVINRDLECGATSSTANKVWPGLFPKPSFMLAETDPKRIVYPAISDVKEDGTRGKFIYADGTVDVITRNGNIMELHGTFDAWARLYLNHGDTLDGELVAFNPDGTRMDRKTSNGIINKAVKGTISPEEAELIRFIAWDIESYDGVLVDRRVVLAGLINAAEQEGCHKVMMIESRVVNSHEEAVEHFKEARRAGLEGTILKNINSHWQPKRSFDYVKFKAEIEAEFKVVGFEYGTGKNAGRVGNLLIESACGKIKCGVGIFKDFDESVRDDLIGRMPKVVTILYNERIEKKGSDTQSLFLPRVTQLRWDKDEANTLEEIIEIEKGVLL